MYEQLVAEYLDFTPPEYVPRDLGLLSLVEPAKNNLVRAVIGVRRCGKTFSLYQLMDQLLRTGVPRELVFYFAFDDDRIDAENPTCAAEVFDAYRALVPQSYEGCYLFFDEIQDVANWEAFVRRVAEREKVTMVISGSSSKLLSTGIPTKLRGRSLAHELWPLSFAEYCRFHGHDTKSRSGVRARRSQAELSRAFSSYLSCGGFPAVQRMEPLERTTTLQSYAEMVIARDVVERFETASYRVATRFARTALRSTGLKFSVNKQLSVLRSSGIKASSESAYALLDDFEDAHLLFKVTDYDLSIRDNPKSAYKVYAVDPGMALAVAPASHLDIGQRLETAVFLELKRRFGADRDRVISSYRGPDCPEVDFVVGDVELEEQYELVKVTDILGQESLAGDLSKRYAREVGNLEAAMRNCELEEGTIVTSSERGEVVVSSGVIRLVPAWEWFLESPTSGGG